METKLTMEPSGSLAPRAIPEPIRVYHDSALRPDGRLAPLVPQAKER